MQDCIRTKRLDQIGGRADAVFGRDICPLPGILDILRPDADDQRAADIAV
jgi:hypothetical protein